MKSLWSLCVVEAVAYALALSLSPSRVRATLHAGRVGEPCMHLSIYRMHAFYSLFVLAYCMLYFVRFVCTTRVGGLRVGVELAGVRSLLRRSRARPPACYIEFA